MAPHEGRELALFKEGKKDLILIDYDKDTKQYGEVLNFICRNMYPLVFLEAPSAVLVARTTSILAEFLKLYTGEEKVDTQEYQRRLGWLFGRRY